MFLPLYNARGVLTAPLRKDGLVLSVDAVLKARLDSLLGNHTYLKLESPAGIEIVKVYATDARGAHIVRALDNTDALAFNQGDSAEYIATAVGVYDSAAPLALVLEGQNAIEVVDYRIIYPTLVIDVLGASQIVGDATDVIIGRVENAYGCCDGDNTPASIPTTPYYLTSLPYPLDVLESMAMGGEFTGFSMLLPPVDDMKVAGYLLQFDMVVTVGYRTYDYKQESIKVQGAIATLDLTVTTGYKTYTWPTTVGPPSSNGEIIVIGSGYITALVMTVTTGYITYSYYPAEAIQFAGHLQDITLT